MGGGGGKPMSFWKEDATLAVDAAAEMLVTSDHQEQLAQTNPGRMEGLGLMGLN